MLNKAKKKAIVEWMNCLLANDPIETLPHLTDGEKFFKLSQLISPTDEDCESTQEKYSFVEKCLSEFYKTSISTHVDFELCENGNQRELASLAILLLTAVVQVSLVSGEASIQGLTQLEPRVQEDIQECISSILFGENKNAISLPPNFSSVLGQQTKYKEQASGPTPKKSGATPSYHTPKRDTRNRKRVNDGQLVASPIPSPLKTLLESPQIRCKVALKEQEREVSRLRGLLHVEQDKNSELENQNMVIKKTISDKDNEITNLKERLNELQNAQDAADELEESSNDVEDAKIQAAIKKERKQNEAVVKERDDLLVEKEQLDQEVCKTTKQLSFAQSLSLERETEIKELQRKIQDLHEIVEKKNDEVKKALEEQKNSEEIARVYQVKYEDEKRKLEEKEECDLSDLEIGESLGMIDDGSNRHQVEKLKAEIGKFIKRNSNQKKKEEELNTQNQKLTNDLESIKSDLLDSKKKIIDLNAKIRDLKADVGKYTLANKKQSSEISGKNSILKELESENDKLKLDKEKLQSKVERMSSEIGKFKSRNRRSSSRDLSSLETECEKLREECSFYREKSEKTKKCEQELKQKNKEIRRLETKMETIIKEKEMLQVSLQKKVDVAEKKASSMKIKYEKELEQQKDNKSTIDESLENKLKTTECSLGETKVQLAKTTKDLQFVTNEYERLSNECEKLSNNYGKLESDNQELQNQINVAALDIQSFQQSINHSLEEKNLFLAKNEEQIIKYGEMLFEKDTKIDELRARCNEIMLEKESVEIQRNERIAEVQFLQSRNAELVIQYGELKKNYEDLQFKCEELKFQVDNISDVDNKSFKTIINDADLKNEETNSLLAKAKSSPETSETFEKILSLEVKLKSAETEIETYAEKIEDLERKLSAAYKIKEHVEKEYYLCIQQKDRIIEELECKNSELQFALKEVDSKVFGPGRISAEKEKIPAVQLYNSSSIEQNNDINSKVYSQELSNLEKKVEEMEIKLTDKRKELKESWKREEILEEKYQELYYSIRQKILECEASGERKLMTVQEKLRETEQKLTETDVSKMNIEMELAGAKKVNAGLIKDLEMLERKLANLEAQDSGALRQELQKMNVSLQDMTEKVRQSEASIKKMRLENRSLLAQLDLANRQIREMKQEADKKISSSTTTSRKSPRFPSRISRTASEKLSKKRGFKKPASPSDKFTSPKKRSSSVREELISKKHRLLAPSPSPSPLKRFFQRSKDNKSKDTRSSSSSVRESKGSPFLLQRNTSRYSNVKETYFVCDKEAALPSTSSVLNKSISSKSKYTGFADWFKCYDEDEYLVFNSLPTLSGYRSLANDSDESGSRVSELQRRNTLVPPHMRTSYPVEMQMQPETKYTHDAIREGPIGKDDDDTVDSEPSDSESSLPDSENPYILWKQKMCAGLSPESSEEKLNEQPDFLEGLPRRVLNPYTPSGKRRNPFQLPYVPASEKKKKRDEKGGTKRK